MFKVYGLFLVLLTSPFIEYQGYMGRRKSIPVGAVSQSAAVGAVAHIGDAEAYEIQWHRDCCKCSKCLEANADGRSSIEILIAWLTYLNPVTQEFENFLAWKGGKKSKSGKSKQTVCSEVYQILLKHNLHRDARSVKNKAIKLLSNYASYKDFMENTGK